MTADSVQQAENSLKVLEPSSSRLKIKSYSKVNFGLWVKNKREDGYHDLETIFYENQNLYDEIDIFYEDVNVLSINVSFDDEKLNKEIPQEKNIVYKALDLYFKKIQITGNIVVKIKKNIPMQAGLGGGSSNAACVLKAINKMLNGAVDENNLLDIAASIGSDVPFFLIGGLCFAQGRGERLIKLENNLDVELKIVKPKHIAISTQLAYEELDKKSFKEDKAEKIKNIKCALSSGNYELFRDNLFNDFEDFAFQKYPELLELKNNLLSEEFDYVGLCGSGSALFGIKSSC